MAPPSSVIPFFTDQNVADPVGDVLASRGHRLTRLRDVMPAHSPDQVVAAACSLHGQVLVTHDKDFKAMAKRLGYTQMQFRHSLHRIQLRCPEFDAATRVGLALSLIEAEWELASSDQPMVIELTNETIRVWR